MREEYMDVSVCPPEKLYIHQTHVEGFAPRFSRKESAMYSVHAEEGGMWAFTAHLEKCQEKTIWKFGCFHTIIVHVCSKCSRQQWHGPNCFFSTPKAESGNIQLYVQLVCAPKTDGGPNPTSHQFSPRLHVFSNTKTLTSSALLFLLVCETKV